MPTSRPATPRQARRPRRIAFSTESPEVCARRGGVRRARPSAAAASPTGERLSFPVLERGRSPHRGDSDHLSLDAAGREHRVVNGPEVAGIDVWGGSGPQLKASSDALWASDPSMLHHAIDNEAQNLRGWSARRCNIFDLRGIDLALEWPCPLSTSTCVAGALGAGEPRWLASDPPHRVASFSPTCLLPASRVRCKQNTHGGPLTDSCPESPAASGRGVRW